MYRVIAIVVGGLALAACTSSSQWLNLDFLKPGPTVETVRFETMPPGAAVLVSNGQTCQTPCALSIPHPKSGGYAVTFTLNGYLPDTEQLQLTSMGDNSSQLRPNPVVVQMTPTPPPPKVKKRRRHHVSRRKVKRHHVVKPAAKKRKAKPVVHKKPAAAAPVQRQQASSPWPPVQQRAPSSPWPPTVVHPAQ